MVNPRRFPDSELVERNPKLDVDALHRTGSLFMGQISRWACHWLTVTIRAAIGSWRACKWRTGRSSCGIRPPRSALRHNQIVPGPDGMPPPWAGTRQVMRHGETQSPASSAAAPARRAPDRKDSTPRYDQISGDGAWMNFRFSRALPPGGLAHVRADDLEAFPSGLGHTASGTTYLPTR